MADFDDLFEIAGIDRLPKILRYMVVFAMIGAGFWLAEQLWEKAVKHLD